MASMFRMKGNSVTPIRGLRTNYLGKLSANEIDFFIALVQQSFQKRKKLAFTFKQLQVLSEHDRSSKDFVKDLMKVCGGLLSVSPFIDEGDVFTEANCWDSFFILYTRQLLIVEIGDYFQEHFSWIKQWTRTQFEQLFSLHSEYAEKIFWLIKSNQTEGYMKLSAKKFFKQLNVSKYYWEHRPNLKERILDPIEEELTPIVKGFKMNLIHEGNQDSPIVDYEFSWDPQAQRNQNIAAKNSSIIFDEKFRAFDPPADIEKYEVVPSNHSTNIQLVDNIAEGHFGEDNRLDGYAGPLPVGNLLRVFKELSTVQHKLLDILIINASYPLSNDNQLNIHDILYHLGMRGSGANYHRIVGYLQKISQWSVSGILGNTDHEKDYVFKSLSCDNGLVKYKFDELVYPEIDRLKEHYDTDYLELLPRIYSKYTMMMLKLWLTSETNSGNFFHNQRSDVVVQDTLDSWESFFLASNKVLAAGQFYQRILKPAIDDIRMIYPDAKIRLEPQRAERRVVRYRLEIHPE